MTNIIRETVLFAILLTITVTGYCHTMSSINLNPEKDSLQAATKQNPTPQVKKEKTLVKLFTDLFIKSPRPYVDEKARTIEYYSTMSGRRITDIRIIPLQVFGPTFEDTARKAKSWFERNANVLHTKSNLKSLEKMLLVHIGDTVNPKALYENERIIRMLPYIKDLRIKIKPDSIYPGNVKVYFITKDRFSFGASGGVEGSESIALDVYNKNIFGIGHEITLRFIGHLEKQPYTGFETYYKIHNIKGKFIDISGGYFDNYRKRGFAFTMNKPFITPTVKWGYGASAIRLYKSDRIFDNDLIYTKIPLNLSFFDAWAGRSINLNQFNSQMVFSLRALNRTFYSRPVSYDTLGQYYSNSTFYLAGITFSQRHYIQDQLIYSYGITEDIPEGFKNEIVYGFDANEFGNRHYAHVYLSNGNLLEKSKGYLYVAGGIGGYFYKQKYQQGQIEANVNYISRQFNAGKKRLRLFVHSNYIIGINRFQIENLELRYNEQIRGFKSMETIGKQRLSLNLEYVMFFRKEIYKFSLAPFGFTDIGIIGSNNQLIFTQDYYSGIGLGIRLHNENFAFETLHIRFAIYPFHPKDIGLLGFVINEQLKKKFYNFEPIAPQPLRFE